MRLSETSVFELIELIYAAAADGSRWSDFLARYAAVTRGSVASFVFQDLRDGRGSLQAAVNCDPEWMQSYATYYGQRNVWMAEGAHKMTGGAVLMSEEMAPTDLVLRSEFYADYLQPQDVLQQIAAIVVHDAQRVAGFTVMRSAADEAFTAEELRIARTLLPHVQRALDLHGRLTSLAGREAAAMAALDRAAYGVFVMDGAGNVSSSNREGRRIVERSDGLSVRGGRLRAATASDSYRLDAAVAAANACARGESFATGATLTIHRPSGAPAYVVEVSVLPANFSAGDFAAAAATVAVFVGDSTRSFHVRPDVLMALYSLTRAEAELTAHLVAGETLHMAAEARRITPETARTYLKRILAKTHTARQSELVRKLLLETGMIS